MLSVSKFSSVTFIPTYMYKEITVQPQILSAEPIGTKTIAVTTKGAADISSIKVTLNKKVGE